MRPRSTLIAALVGFVAAVLAGAEGLAADADPPPAPSELRFDPAKMPEPAGTSAALGYRYSRLSPAESKRLRRGFKLPMEALSSGDTLASLRRALVVAPLPNPEQPFLRVEPAAGDSNPFTGSRVTSFRANPMRAFGELLGAAAGDEGLADTAGGADPFGGGASEDPFAGSAGGDFADATPEVTDEADDSADPFDDAADPFGGGASDDPFADF